MVDGAVHIVDDFHRQYRRQIFGMPVFFRRGINIGQQFTGTLTATQFHAKSFIGFGQFRQDIGGHGLMHQQGFHGVTGAVAVCLGVDGDIDGLGFIGEFVDIHMADTIQMLDHNHLGVTADTLNQAFATARYDNVHILRHGD